MDTKRKNGRNNLLYYHLTDKENLKTIFQEGLKPLIGENSKLGGEKEPAIYLCRRKDLPYWKILLNKNIPICINLTKEQEKNIELFNYSNYSEFLYKDIIHKEQIKLSKCKIKTENAMKDLCISYIYSIGNICSDIIRYYYTNPKDINQCEFLKHALRCTLNCLSHLDYTSLSQLEIINTIKDSGDGAFAFTDKYFKEDIRLYEKISMYGNDELSKYTSQLTEFVKHTFKDFLKINTGGWSM